MNVVLRATLCPRFDIASWIRRDPHVRFSFAIRTARPSSSSRVRGRPDLRFSWPSYFWAISLRCQANKVSGVCARCNTSLIANCGGITPAKR